MSYIRFFNHKINLNANKSENTDNLTNFKIYF